MIRLPKKIFVVLATALVLQGCTTAASAGAGRAAQMGITSTSSSTASPMTTAPPQESATPGRTATGTVAVEPSNLP